MLKLYFQFATLLEIYGKLEKNVWDFFQQIVFGPSPSSILILYLYFIFFLILWKCHLLCIHFTCTTQHRMNSLPQFIKISDLIYCGHNLLTCKNYKNVGLKKLQNRIITCIFYINFILNLKIKLQINVNYINNYFCYFSLT